MIEKFNGIIYLIVFIVHFLGFGIYAYQMIINNKNFRAKFEMDETATPVMRMIGASFLGALLMALYIMFIRPGGVEGTWAFFNLVFVESVKQFEISSQFSRFSFLKFKNFLSPKIFFSRLFSIHFCTR